MHRHRVTRVLPFRPEQLFDLVGGIEDYPEFVPWISSMRILGRRAVAEEVDQLDAEASVGFSFLTERFSTRVTRDRDAKAIDVRLISGPFKRLENSWRFEPHPAGCKVIFDIDFAFKSRMLDLVLAANFDRAVDKLIHCFEARATKLYGKVQSIEA